MATEHGVNTIRQKLSAWDNGMGEITRLKRFRERVEPLVFSRVQVGSGEKDIEVPSDLAEGMKKDFLALIDLKISDVASMLKALDIPASPAGE